MKVTILETVKLSFNPQRSNEQIQKIFANDLARTLWLAIRQGHMKSQYFDSLILSNSEIIRKEKDHGKLNADLLLSILSGVSRRPDHGLIGPREVEFAEALLPFIVGEKSINYELDASVAVEEEYLQNMRDRIPAGQASPL